MLWDVGELDLESWVGDGGRWISDEEGEEPKIGGGVGKEELGNGDMQGIERWTRRWAGYGAATGLDGDGVDTASWLFLADD